MQQRRRLLLSCCHRGDDDDTAGVVNIIFGLDVNFNLDDTDDTGDTALHIACRHSNATAVRRLLCHSTRATGGHVWPVNAKKETALHVACLSHWQHAATVEIVTSLLQHGFDAAATDKVLSTRACCAATIFEACGELLTMNGA